MHSDDRTRSGIFAESRASVLGAGPSRRQCGLAALGCQYLDCWSGSLYTSMVITLSFYEGEIPAMMSKCNQHILLYPGVSHDLSYDPIQQYIRDFLPIVIPFTLRTRTQGFITHTGVIRPRSEYNDLR